MTIFVSIFGFIGRAAGRLLTTALGWAGSLMFGRVPQSHQFLVTLLMGGSLVWVILIGVTLLPGVTAFLLDSTPHPAFIGLALVRVVVLLGLILLPLGVGVAGVLAPAPEDRPTGLLALRQIIAGYPIALLMTAILVFLAGVGVARKAANARRGWSDTHIPIIVKPGGYDRMVSDLRTALDASSLQVSPTDAPRVLSVPGHLLAAVAGRNVRSLVPDRLVQLKGSGLSIDLYPSDIAISGARKERMRARIAIVSRIPWTSAHLTTSAEAQAIEDRLEQVEQRAHPSTAPGSRESGSDELAAIDRVLVDVDLPVEEWDILYRLRLQVERDILATADTARRQPGGTGVGPASTPNAIAAAP